MHSIVIIGSLIGLGFSALYLIETIKGTVQPNKVTWLIWALAPLISAVAAFFSGVTWAALPVLGSGIGPLLIFIASFFNKTSYWEMTRFDLICGGFSIFSLVAWFLSKDANIAIVLSLTSDMLAALPTLIKGWKFPETENGWLYLGSVVSASASFTEINHWTFAEVAFPIYLILIGVVFCAVFEWRKYQLNHQLNKIKKS